MERLRLCPARLVVGEAQLLAAAMRANSRWAVSSQNTEGSLMKGLRSLVPLMKPFASLPVPPVDALVYIQPFLNVICSEETSGPITGVALSAVHKFLTLGVIQEGTPGATQAMIAIAEAATHCRFEATEPESDEVVLMQILRVLHACVRCPAGAALTDDVVIEMVQTCFRMSMSIQLRLSELLRRTAEHTLADMLQGIFVAGLSRLRAEAADGAGAAAVATPAPDSVPSPPPSPASTLAGASYINGQGVRFQRDDEPPRATPAAPYGAACLAKLFRFLCSLTSCDKDPSNFEQLRLLGLKLLVAVLEACGPALHVLPSLLGAVQDELCRFLLQNLATENLALLTLTLRALVLIYLDLRAHLTAQLELMFTTLVTVADSRGSSLEKQELIVEAIAELCREPSLASTLYVNYDCDLTRSNVLELLTRFLRKTAAAQAGALLPVHMAALDALLAMVDATAVRANGPASPSASAPSVVVLENSPSSLSPTMLPVDADELRRRKREKNVYAAAAEHFNRAPKEAIEFLKGCGVLGAASAPDPAALAAFLRHTPGLNTRLVGELLGKSNDFNVAVLRAYVALFDFRNMSIDMALRTFFEAFWLPGEAQIIARILEIWAARFFSANPAPFADSGVIYVLAYALIMLNVDAHHRHVKQRMTQEQFIHNLRGVNGNADLPRDMLAALYHSVTSNEIKPPEEMPVQASLTELHAAKWKSNITHRSRRLLTGDNTQLDRDVFAVLWGPAVAATGLVFDAAHDERLVRRALEGFTACALLAAHFRMPDVLDNVLVSLCKAAALERLAWPHAPGAGTAGAGAAQSVAQLSRETVHALGSDRKAQAALEAAASVARAHGEHVREGWRNLMALVVALHRLRLLPDLADLPDVFALASRHAAAPGARKPASTWMGWIWGSSAAATSPTPAPSLTSSGSGTSLAPPTASSSSAPPSASASVSASGSTSPATATGVAVADPEAEAFAEAERRARECVARCGLAELVQGTGTLAKESLVYLVKAVILATVPPALSRAASHTQTQTQAQSKGALVVGPLTSDEAVGMLGVDLLTRIALQNAARIAYVWLLVYEHFTALITGGGALASPRLAEKALAALFTLATQLGAHSGTLADQLLKALGVAAKMDASLQALSGDIVMRGVERLLDAHAHTLHSDAAWTSLLSLLALPPLRTAPLRERVVHLLRALVSDPKAVHVSNFRALFIAVADAVRLHQTESKVAIETMELLPVLLSRMPTPAHVVSVAPSSPSSLSAADALSASAAEAQQTSAQQLQHQDGWDELWRPALEALAGLCGDARLEVRNHAMTYLQRALLSPAIQVLTPSTWQLCFEDVLFPLLNDLLRLDAPAIDETRGRACALLSKIFLQYMLKLSLLPDFSRLWLRVLHALQLYMRADASEGPLAETVKESLKNMILVMSAAGVFPAQLWQLTWDTLSHFSPPLTAELVHKVEAFLPAGHLPPRTSPTTTTPPTGPATTPVTPTSSGQPVPVTAATSPSRSSPPAAPRTLEV